MLGSNQTHLPGTDLLSAGYAFDAAEMVDVTMCENDGDEGSFSQLPVDYSQRFLSRFHRDQRIDQDAASGALDDAHIREIIAANLINAIRNLEQPVDVVELRLTPQTGIDACWRFAGDEILYRAVPNYLPRGVPCHQGVISRNEPAARILELSRVSERQLRRHGRIHVYCCLCRLDVTIGVRLRAEKLARDARLFSTHRERQEENRSAQTKQGFCHCVSSFSEIAHVSPFALSLWIFAFCLPACASKSSPLIRHVSAS